MRNAEVRPVIDKDLLAFDCKLIELDLVIEHNLVEQTDNISDDGYRSDLITGITIFRSCSHGFLGSSLRMISQKILFYKNRHVRQARS